MINRSFLIFFVLIFTASLSAQTDQCNCNNLSLRELYKIGQFESLKQNISCCKNNFSKSDKNRADELLALTAIAEDSIDLAKEFLKNIVLSDQDYEPNSKNIIFLKLFEESLDENIKIRISSLSKRPEDIKTAPAIVEMITSDEIIDAGYNDITEILSNLPGFDISMSKGIQYSNIYQMGFRSDTNERTLLMIDGVEENDVYLNWAYVSRQYPISNIKAIEIIYGPASTIYGPRAFVGAINIITYQPNEKTRNYFTGKFGEKNKLKLRGNISSGSFNTKNIDVSLSNSLTDNLSIQITGRIFQSDENDMSNVPFLNYDVNDLDKFQYDHLIIENDFENDPIDRVASFLSSYSAHQNDFYTYENNQIKLTDKARNLALQYDKEAYSGQINGHEMTPSNSSKDYFFEAKISSNNLIVGYRFWRLIEGWGGWYNDLEVAPSKNGANWSPQNRTFYLKYNNTLNEKISLSFQSAIRNHGLGDKTVRTMFRPFGNPGSKLTLADLIDYSDFKNNYPIFSVGDYSNPLSIQPGFNKFDKTSDKYYGWLNRYYFYQATQGRLEGRVYYDSEKLKFMSGVDFRLTSSQGDYLIYYDSNWRGDDFLNNQINHSYAQEFGTAGGSLSSNELHRAGSNMYLLNDLGVFFQGSYKLTDNLIFNSGIRYDRQQQRESGDKGYEVFLPRLGLVFTNKNNAIKFNYSKGFQQPSLWARFSTAGIRVPNPSLKPEGINYFDLSITGTSKNRNISWNIGVYDYQVFDAIKLVDYEPIDASLSKYSKHVNQNEYDIFGAIFSLKAKSKSGKFKLNFNGNYTSPKTFSEDGNIISIADISKFRLNFGVTKLIKINNLNASINLRGNYVSSRPVGEGTSVSGNYGINYSNEIPSYFVLNSNLILRHSSFKNMYIGISLNNILNEVYYHPGIRKARAFFDVPNSRVKQEDASDYAKWYSNSLGSENSPYIPQSNQNYLLKLVLDY